MLKKHIASVSAFAVAAASLSLTLITPAIAAPTVTLSGEASIAGGVLTLVSDAAPGFGVARFNQTPATFADLITLSTDFNVTDDNCGGGSPRFQISIDKTGDMVHDGNMFVYLGPSPSFTTCTPNTWTPTGNLMTNSDACRWDTSQLAAGTQCSTPAAAQAAFGTGNILGIRLIVESGWNATASGGDGEQTVEFDNTTINSDVYPFDPIPDAPLFWAEEDTTQVKVDWKAVSGATSYTVYHSTDNVTFAPVFSGNALTYTHAVAVGTDNYYKVTAENVSGESGSGAGIAAKYAGTKDVVIDDGSMAADFNTSGTATPTSGAWTPFDVNHANPGVQQILSYATGGDNYSVLGAYAGQTFDWVTGGALNGHYDVFVNYICDSSRGVASYNVFSDATQLNTGALLVNQALRTSDGTPCGSQAGDPTTQTFWKKIGNFPITGIARVQLASATGNHILADAVAFHKTGNIASSSSSTSSTPSSSSSSSVSSCAAVSTVDLLGYWKLDENSGTTAIDSAGGDNNGAHENGPAYVAGTPAIVPNPSALNFDGTDDQVRIANSNDFAFGTGAFTVSTFVKTSTGDRSVLGNFSNGLRGWGLYIYNSQRANFFGYGTMGINDVSFATPGILDNNWHHIAGVFTRSGNNLTIETYYDGVSIGTHTVAVGDITSGSDLLLGKYLLQPNYAGSLDDVRVYGRALSASEIQNTAGGCAGSSSSASSVPVSSSSASSVSSAVSSASSAASSVNPALVCDGKIATIRVQGGVIVGGPSAGNAYTGTLNGTSGNDVIIGTAGNDKINGNSGNDTICGRGGNDELDGGNGDDALFGEGNDDELDGGNGNDRLDGGAGNDELDGGNNEDFLIGGPGNDTLDAGSGLDIACGGANNDTIEGGSNNDKLDGGPGTDTLKGELGTDICRNGESLNSCENTVTAIPECAGL